MALKDLVVKKGAYDHLVRILRNFHRDACYPDAHPAEIDAAMRALLKRVEEDGLKEWWPIETAPLDEQILVSTDAGVVGEARYHEDHGWFWANTAPTDAHDGQIYTATLWMPLPKAPSAQEKAGA